MRIQNTGIELVSTRSSRSVDSRELSSGSAEMDCPLTGDEIARHEFGFFVAQKQIHKPPAVGYVACKKIEPGVLPINSDGTEQWMACVGGLYLLPEHRRLGLAARLVRTITNEIFAIEPEVNACVAQCNELSAPVFSALGYVQGEATVDEKIPHQITRKQWEVSF